MRRTALAIAVVGVVACTGPLASTDESAIAVTDPAVRVPMGLAAGSAHSCVLARRGVRCWGKNDEGQASPPPLKNPRQISAGNEHTCALDDDGMKCWGNNYYGQAKVPALRRPTQIATGFYHSCVIDDGVVKCWGDNIYGQLILPRNIKNPTRIAAGYFHTCLLDDDGVKCWGQSTSNQTTVPTTLVHPTALAASSRHTCALDDEGVKCWGYAGAGATTVPTTLRHPRQIGAGSAYSCALDDEGVKCWGSSAGGQLAVPPLHRPSQIGIGPGHACALDDEGVKCWGSNYASQTIVPSDLELVGRHLCALSNGAARCVGDNETGQLGIESDVDQVVPLATASTASLGRGFAIAELALGRAFGCARDGEGRVKCWGGNDRGQLGLGDTRSRGVAAGEMGDALPVLPLQGTKVAVGDRHACAITKDGDTLCWGDNSYGQLGSSPSADVTVPTSLGRKARGLALGAAHTCLLAEGVSCFGANDRGQLGHGQVDLGADFRVEAIASGERHVCALSVDGRVKCWGANDHGELGLGDGRDRGVGKDDLGDALPAIDLGRGQLAKELACGARHCCIRTMQNTMKCWGDSSYGQLGLGDTLPRGLDANAMGDALPFVMTPPRERVLSIDLAAERTCARTESGLRCWGRNRSGELGYGDRQPRGGTPATVPRLLGALGI